MISSSLYFDTELILIFCCYILYFKGDLTQFPKLAKLGQEISQKLNSIDDFPRYIEKTEVENLLKKGNFTDDEEKLS